MTHTVALTSSVKIHAMSMPMCGPLTIWSKIMIPKDRAMWAMHSIPFCNKFGFFCIFCNYKTSEKIMHN